MADTAVNNSNGANGHEFVHDGSSQPAPVSLPELFFKARCAAPGCRALLGGFHVPAVGGVVVFACAHCGRTTVFKIEAYQIRHALAGPLNGSATCVPTSTRKRQGKAHGG